MKILYCWRCKMDVPMLDEEEYLRIEARYNEILWNKDREDIKLKGAAWRKQNAQDEVLNEYNKITGFGETNYLAVWHHRISLYGPPCAQCGKLLRTKKAKFCAACGWKRPLNEINE